MNGQKSFRSILSLVLAVLLVCAAAGCANIGAPAQSGAPAGMRVTVRQKAFETEERMAFEWAESGEAAIASGVYTAVEIDDASAERFPKLAEALAQRNKSYDDGFLPMFADLAAMARDSQGEPWGGAPMTEERVIEIGRADSAILSMMVTMSGYYGGAHPLTYFYSENYVPETGAELSLDEVLNPAYRDALPQLIYDHIETLSEDYEFTDEDRDRILESLGTYIENDTLTWMLDETGITFWFDAYALMYYAFGPIFSTIPYEEEPELLVEAFRPGEEPLDLEGRCIYLSDDPVVLTEEQLSAYLPEEEPMEEWEPLPDEMLLTVSQQELATEEMLPSETDYPDAYASLNYPIVILNEDTAATWPDLAHRIGELNEELGGDALQTFSALATQAEKAIDAGLTDAPFSEDRWLYVARADSAVLSMTLSVISSYGGLEESVLFRCFNFEPDTGAVLPLAEAVSSPAQLETLPQQIIEQLTPMYSTDFPEGIDKNSFADRIAEMIDSEELVWALGEDGIQIGFAPYQLTDGFDEPCTCLLRYDEYPELLAEQYLPIEGLHSVEQRAPDAWPDPITYSLADLTAIANGEAVG